MKFDNLSAEEKERLETIDKIRKKAQEIVKPLLKEMEENKLKKGESGVLEDDNRWGLKPRKHTHRVFDFSID